MPESTPGWYFAMKWAPVAYLRTTAGDEAFASNESANTFSNVRVHSVHYFTTFTKRWLWQMRRSTQMHGRCSATPAAQPSRTNRTTMRMGTPYRRWISYRKLVLLAMVPSLGVRGMSTCLFAAFDVDAAGGPPHRPNDTSFEREPKYSPYQFP